MSKYTNGALQVLETADKDINQTFTYTEETSECVFCSTRRESGWVTVEKSGIISKIGEGIADIEKNFELDGEDLIEEQEREFSRFSMTPSFQ